MAKYITLDNLSTFKTKYDAVMTSKHTEAMNAASDANTVATDAKTLANSKYTKPTGGIPKTDLASAVQTSLGKADTALQSHQTIATGSSNGAISVGGTDVFVKGLGALAYKTKLSATDVGLGSVEDHGMDTTPTDGSDNYVTSGGVKDYIDSAISAVNQFSYEIVSSLDTASASTMGKIYLVPCEHDNVNQEPDSYDEFITLRIQGDDELGTETAYTWEKIGNTDVNLYGYVNAIKTPASTAGVITDVSKDGGILTFTYSNLSTSAPTASGEAVAFIDSISQDSKGKITATKKTVRSASQSAAGLMSAADKTKLDGITEATTAEIKALFA